MSFRTSFSTPSSSSSHCLPLAFRLASRGITFAHSLLSPTCPPCHSCHSLSLFPCVCESVKTLRYFESVFLLLRRLFGVSAKSAIAAFTQKEGEKGRERYERGSHVDWRQTRGQNERSGRRRAAGDEWHTLTAAAAAGGVALRKDHERTGVTFCHPFKRVTSRDGQHVSLAVLVSHLPRASLRTHVPRLRRQGGWRQGIATAAALRHRGS